ncbi:hypothetical protein P775_08510 [Puniceibacterium antarcticum]|uniref:Probable chemoreceptor glutamine deamidase CheD n=1 Tax=Puniceibacterium antarcticum TaxID=1206336 RepID=A0A2G8RGM6_9RHOB|nr:chemotaxis protein CheD [Puniceibacterium antarcticum]PIL20561.1 hypothetical protein P775_08510 [Puniceibacterium antarcticum]
MMPENKEEKIINVIQGEYAIDADPNIVLTTVLGSCVAVCLTDPVAAIGGMNHFLLPQKDGKAGESFRYGAYSMELLINGLLKRGARKDRLVAKMFGGASMNSTLRDIGGSNVAFAREFLANESIPCGGESVGGNSARRIRFWPTTGQVKQFLVPGAVEPTPPPQPKPVRAAADITLF